MRKACSASMLSVVLILSLVLALPAAAIAEVPRLDIAENTLGSGINPQQLAVIKTYVTYWIGALIQAKDEKSIIDARKTLEEGFKRFDSLDYRLTYAKQTAELLMAPFQKGLGETPQRQIKELNLALAISQMPQASIEPLLAVMVTHNNPAVRYEGWVSYRAISPHLLLSGPAQQMLNLLSQQAAKETSAPVIGAILQTLSMGATVGTSLPADNLKAVQKQALQIIGKNWIAWCKRVSQGDVEMTIAAIQGVDALQNIGSAVEAKPVLQMLVTMAWVSSRAADEGKDNKDLVTANTMLLLGCETAMTAISKSSSAPIMAILSKQKPGTDKWADIRMAVIGKNGWVDILKSQGVVEPTLEEPKPTTVPTSAPASKPAGK